MRWTQQHDTANGAGTFRPRAKCGAGDWPGVDVSGVGRYDGFSIRRRTALCQIEELLDHIFELKWLRRIELPCDGCGSDFIGGDLHWARSGGGGRCSENFATAGRAIKMISPFSRSSSIYLREASLWFPGNSFFAPLNKTFR